MCTLFKFINIGCLKNTILHTCSSDGRLSEFEAEGHMSETMGTQRLSVTFKELVITGPDTQKHG